MSHHDSQLLKDTRRGRSARGGAWRFVRVGETHVGRGVFARRRLPAGLVLGEIAGIILPDSPADASYVMELPSGRVLDPAEPLRYANHCCDPNCEIFYWEGNETEPQEDRLWMQTIRPVEAGAEILIDYSWPADAAIPCRCRADCCRGWIVDPAERHLLPDPPAA
jgi:hypothetical protein